MTYSEKERGLETPDAASASTVEAKTIPRDEDRSEARKLPGEASSVRPGMTRSSSPAGSPLGSSTLRLIKAPRACTTTRSMRLSQRISKMPSEVDRA